MNSARKAKIDDLLKQTYSKMGGAPANSQAAFIAEIHSLIAEEQAESAEKLERYTVALVRLTWAVVVLTGLLVILTCWQLAKGTHGP